MNRALTFVSMLMLLCTFIGAQAETVIASTVTEDFGYGYSVVSAGGDYIMVLEGPNTFKIKIFKSADGGSQYNEVYQQDQQALINVATNGDWFGIFDSSQNIAQVFRLDENGNTKDSSFIYGLPEDNSGLLVKFLSDGSLVFLTPSKVTTYKPVESGSNYKQNAFGWEIYNESPLLFTATTISYDSPSIHITDDFISGIDADNKTVYVYERQDDGSWTLVTQMSYASHDIYPYNVAWNGNDALIMSNYEDSDNAGSVWIFTKSGSDWSLTSTLTGSTHQGLGYLLEVIDEDSVAIVSIFDSDMNPFNGSALSGGSVQLAENMNGEWQVTKTITADSTNVLFGMNMAQSYWDVLFYSCAGNDLQSYTCSISSYSLGKSTPTANSATTSVMSAFVFIFVILFYSL